MRYLSVCSGIEAASVAWHHLGWTPVAFSEIEPFPAAVLAHRFPNVPNYGDMTQHEQWPIEPGSIDLLVGGTPCQSFSVAGLRKGISDPRGGLMLTYLEIARRLRPRWIVWENVPGVLSSGGGRDFGAFLGALGELGYGWAYRVLDAQWVRTQRHPRAVPQRRRRVFVVGCLGDWERAAAVLFERESVQRDSAPRRATREGVAADAEAGARAGCWRDGTDCAGTGGWMPNNPGVVSSVCTKWSKGTGGPSGSEHFNLVTHPSWPAEVAPTLNQSARGTGAPGYSDQEIFSQGAGNLVPQPVPYDLFQITAPVNRQNRKPGDPCHTLARDNAAHAAVAFPIDGRNAMRDPDKLDEMNRQGMGIGDTGDPSHTVTAACVHGVAHAAVAFTPGNLARGAGPSPNAEVAPTMKCSAGRGADDQRTCVAFHPTQDPINSSESSHALGTGSKGGCATAAVAQAMQVQWASGGGQIENNTAQALRSNAEYNYQFARIAMTVRRLTPRECERLQGFPDDWTLIPWRKKPADECPDGPRYKALGNSMACNCMAWIGERIAAVEDTHA